MFKPFGFLPGHLVEWAKLLLVLERYRPQDWILPAALRLYGMAITKSADLEHGGLHYSYGPDGRLLDLDKYYWVHSESVAAAAVLAVRTGKERYWQDYDRLWAYSWRHLVDQRRGGWFRIVSQEGLKASEQKSPPGKTDYHPLGACYEFLRTIGAAK